MNRKYFLGAVLLMTLALCQAYTELNEMIVSASTEMQRANER